jgi:hypothetical protein
MLRSQSQLTITQAQSYCLAELIQSKQVRSFLTLYPLLKDKSTMMSLGKAAVLLATIVVSVKAQELDYPVAPTQEWVASLGGGIFDNNGLYTAPDDSIVVSISSDCVVSAYLPVDGTLAWTNRFLPDGEGYQCFGGVTFNYDAATPYLVFSVVDNPLDVLNAST